MAADTDVDVKESVQAAVVAALADLPTRFVWVENRDEVPLDAETREVEGGGTIFTLSAIELQEDGRVHVTASLYFTSLGGGNVIAYALAQHTRDVREAIHFGRLYKTEEDINHLLKIKWPGAKLF